MHPDPKRAPAPAVGRALPPPRAQAARVKRRGRADTDLSLPGLTFTRNRPYTGRWSDVLIPGQEEYLSGQMSPLWRLLYTTRSCGETADAADPTPSLLHAALPGPAARQPQAVPRASPTPTSPPGVQAGCIASPSRPLGHTGTSRPVGIGGGARFQLAPASSGLSTASRRGRAWRPPPCPPADKRAAAVKPAPRRGPGLRARAAAPGPPPRRALGGAVTSPPARRAARSPCTTASAAWTWCRTRPSQHRTCTTGGSGCPAPGSP